MRLHVLLPWNEQAHVFAIEGHRWPLEPGRAGTDLLSAMQVGGMEAVTLHLVGGAGNGLGLAGDFVYGDHRLPYRDAGLWGIFRVHAPCAAGAPRPLAADARCGPPFELWLALAGALALAAAGLALLVGWRARRARAGMA